MPSTISNKDGRSYHHFLIKVEAEPPFRVLQVGLVLLLCLQANGLVSPGGAEYSSILWLGSVCLEHIDAF
jgi:hypothetical protein